MISLSLKYCGAEIGIRTPGSSHFNGFQDRRFRPLSHLRMYYLVNISYKHLFGKYFWLSLKKEFVWCGNIEWFVSEDMCINAKDVLKCNKILYIRECNVLD